MSARHLAQGTIPGGVSRMSPKNCPICSLVRHMPRPNASSMTASSAAESGSPRVRKCETNRQLPAGVASHMAADDPERVLLVQQVVQDRARDDGDRAAEVDQAAGRLVGQDLVRTGGGPGGGPAV